MSPCRQHVKLLSPSRAKENNLIFCYLLIVPHSLYCVSILNQLKFVVTATFCDWTQLQTSEEWSHASITSLPYPGVWPYCFTSDVSKGILKVLSIYCVLKVWLLMISWTFKLFYDFFLGSFNKLSHFPKTLFLCEVDVLGFSLSFFFPFVAPAKSMLIIMNPQ